jgi:hypothetical protein
VKKDLRQEERSVSLGRHQSQCSICSHPQREEIEEEWINWGCTTLLADRYRVSRYSIYRHMRALDLSKERQKKVQSGCVPASPPAQTRPSHIPESPPRPALHPTFPF